MIKELSLSLREKAQNLARMVINQPGQSTCYSFTDRGVINA